MPWSRKKGSPHRCRRRRQVRILTRSGESWKAFDHGYITTGGGGLPPTPAEVIGGGPAGDHRPVRVAKVPRPSPQQQVDPVRQVDVRHVQRVGSGRVVEFPCRSLLHSVAFAVNRSPLKGMHGTPPE